MKKNNVFTIIYTILLTPHCVTQGPVTLWWFACNANSIENSSSCNSVFAHATTAQLSCHVQNFVAITVLESSEQWNEISIELKVQWKIRGWNGVQAQIVVVIQCADCILLSWLVDNCRRLYGALQLHQWCLMAFRIIDVNIKSTWADHVKPNYFYGRPHHYRLQLRYFNCNIIINNITVARWILLHTMMYPRRSMVSVHICDILGDPCKVYTCTTRWLTF